jgi:hypothetical protein
MDELIDIGKKFCEQNNRYYTITHNQGSQFDFKLTITSFLAAAVIFVLGAQKLKDNAVYQ